MPRRAVAVDHDHDHARGRLGRRRAGCRARHRARGCETEPSAVGAFLIYPALTEDFKKNPFDLFGQDEEE